MKTAAVYDRWLSTLGGGEQVAFSLARMLSDLEYKTTILTHRKVDIKKAIAKLQIDPKDISIEYLPELPSNEISAYTEKYDVFVNTSYLDFFPNRAKLGILSVFFPNKIYLTPLEYIKRALVIPSARRLFIYPTRFENFLFDEYAHKKIYKWLNKESSILFNDSIHNLTINLFFQALALSVLETIRFYVDDKEIFPVGRHLNHKINICSFTFHHKINRGQRFRIVLPKTVHAEKVALVGMKIKSPRYFFYNLFKSYFPKWEMRLHGGPGVTKRSTLCSYDKIMTISDFSKKWIKKYWGLQSDVLYPTVNVSDFKPAVKKKNWIIHVGRFFVTGHSKKQLDLVKIFVKMQNEYGMKDWELHFVGSVHEGESHQRYFNQVKHQAEGYPVHFHTDISSKELKKLLALSKIYWHATGLDEDEKTQPILFEHFGITTVEAMASGCVPVVINAGGQKEIVTKESGFLWNTREELMKDTYALIQNSKLLKKISKEAQKRSLFFDRKNGTKRFGQLLHAKNKEMDLSRKERMKYT
jgi:glycosyltransferase involved in cell wall biosynthesis